MTSPETVTPEQAQQALTNQAFDFVANTAAQFLQRGYSLEEALESISVQATYKVILFVGMLPEETRAAVGSTPLFLLPEPRTLPETLQEDETDSLENA